MPSGVPGSFPAAERALWTVAAQFEPSTLYFFPNCDIAPLTAAISSVDVDGIK